MPCIKAEFLEKGFEKASVRSIANRAGMSAAGIYRHFKDKEAMFDALVAPLVDIIFATIGNPCSATMRFWIRKKSKSSG